MKRVLSVQDLSCVGKCALGAALPVISAMGVECCMLPTAVLSTHTAFQHVHLHDLTGEMPSILDAWAQEGLSFDVICVGYLSSVRQIGIVSDLIRRFRKPGVRVLIDPVMGDGGRLYRGFDEDFVRAMRELVRQADVILPNATEAALLLDVPYSPVTDSARAETLLRGILDMGVSGAVLTGVSEGETRLGAAEMAQDGELRLHTAEKLPGSYFGTGDLFAAVLTGALARGVSMEKGMQLAVDFVAEAIRCTLADSEKRFYGVSFEPALGKLIRLIDEA